MAVRNFINPTGLTAALNWVKGGATKFSLCTNSEVPQTYAEMDALFTKNVSLASLAVTTTATAAGVQIVLPAFTQACEFSGLVRSWAIHDGSSVIYASGKVAAHTVASGNIIQVPEIPILLENAENSRVAQNYFEYGPNVPGQMLKRRIQFNYPGTYEYSFDNGETWTNCFPDALNGVGSGEFRVSDHGEPMLVRGKASQTVAAAFCAIGLGGSSADYDQDDFYVRGNLLSLVDYQYPEKVDLSINSFASLFWASGSSNGPYNNRRMQARELVLPGKTTEWMYANAFAYTEQLRSVRLPARQLAAYCYTSMFLASGVREIWLGADSVSPDSAFQGWLQGHTYSSGVIHTRPGVVLPSNDNGLPSGWTQVEDYVD